MDATDAALPEDTVAELPPSSPFVPPKLVAKLSPIETAAADENKRYLRMMVAATNDKRYLRHIKGEKPSDEALAAHVANTSHLNLQGRALATMDGLDAAVGLRVLYMYNNKLDRITSIDKCTKLTHAYLSKNAITQIEGLPLASLEKLYLDENCLSVVDGLEGATGLTDLAVARQTPARAAAAPAADEENSKLHLPLAAKLPLSFGRDTLYALSSTLCVLNVAGNGIRDFDWLFALRCLQKLDASHNQLEGLHQVVSILSGLRRLEDVDFRGNPVTQASQYREEAIAASTFSLAMLDDVPIEDQQRRMLQHLSTHRRKVRTGNTPRTSRGPSRAAGGEPSADRRLAVGDLLHCQSAVASPREYGQDVRPSSRNRPCSAGAITSALRMHQITSGGARAALQNLN